MLSTEKLAEEVNQDVLNFRYFWAYGLLRETAGVWVGENLHLLSKDAKVILRSVKKAVKEQKGKTDGKEIKRGGKSTERAALDGQAHA